MIDKQHRAVSIESTQQQQRSRSCLQQPQWFALVVLSLLMIYFDSKRISACITIDDRPISMSKDFSKYTSSLVDALTAVKSGTPEMLRGSRPTSRSGTFTGRQTSVRVNRSSSNDPAIQLLHQQHPLSYVVSHNEQASIHSRTSGTEETSTPTKHQNQPPEHDNINGDAPSYTTGGSSNDAPSNEQNDDSNDENDGLSEQTSRNEVSESDATNRPKVLCLTGESYGRTMNQYLQLATILHQLGINGTSVVAFKNPMFTSFYTTWFEPRDDIIVQYADDAPCDAEYDAVTLHYLFFADKWKQVAYQFKTLMPKASIQEEAERVMKEYAGPANVPITTVHRRDLEGACVLFAESKNLIACPNIKSSLEMSTAEYKDACLIDYPMIANATNGTSVILLTDGQVPKLDETFPIISKHSFPVQAWMMAISNIHYGNPFSTVDLVVYFWRMALADPYGNHDEEGQQQQQQQQPQYHMQPSTCYKPTPLE